MTPTTESRQDSPGRNTASGNARIGMQVSTVHGDLIYQTDGEFSPEKKYEVGLKYLSGDMPRYAEKMFQEAFAEGFKSTGVAYYWALAVLSDRSYHQLGPDEFASLQSALMAAESQHPDECLGALEVVKRLIGCLSGQEETGGIDQAELDDVLKAYGGLQEGRRDEIRRHLDMILTGSVQDEIDVRFADEVRTQRLAGEREQRVWKFFEPDPEPPKLMPLHSPVLTVGQRAAAALGGTLAGLGLVCLAAASAANAAPLAIAAVLVLVGGYIAVRCGITWFAVRERLADIDRRHGKSLPASRYSARPAAGGRPTPDLASDDEEDDEEEQRAARERHEEFVRLVPAFVRLRFAERVPRKQKDRRKWEADTAGIARALTADLIKMYKDMDIDVRAIDWLIRWHAKQAASKWQADEPRDGRPPSAAVNKLGLGAGVGVFGLGVLIAVTNALATQPGSAVAGALLLGFGGWVLFKSRVDVFLVQRHRFARDRADATARLRDEEAEYRRWCDVLKGRPQDDEMARWLDYDKMYLKTMAMNQHGLANRDIIAHVALTQGAEHASRARVLYGPPRYSAYVVVLFLLTEMGLRQVSFELDFATGAISNQTRIAFRYGSIVSVRVAEIGHRTDNGRRQVIPLDGRERADGQTNSLIIRQAFSLALADGQAISVSIENFDAGFLDRVREDPNVLLELALDTSGVNGALRVLEAVAAEGQEWLVQERERRTRRVRDYQRRLSRPATPAIGPAGALLEIGASSDDDS
jgi:hypothetical protein